MPEYFYTTGRLLAFSAVLLILQECCILVHSNPIEFKCSRTSGDPLPYLPMAYSTSMRLNFPRQEKTVEARHVVNALDHKESFEFFSDKRHVKYIRRTDDKVFLFIDFTEDEYPKCTVNKLDMEENMFQSEDSGPNDIIWKLLNVVGSRDGFYIADNSLDNGIYIRRWEGCFKDPKVNVSVAFTAPSWNQARKSALRKNANYLVAADAQIENDYVGILFFNFDPNTPDELEFQPPENSFCEGFREDEKLPPLPNYFSYNAEIVVFQSPEAIAPIVSHRKVYYDYPANISRTDFYDPLAEDKDMFSPVRAKQKSIIHDFTSEIEYTMDLTTGKCSVDPFKTTLNVITVKETMDKMPNATKFFGLDGTKTSYNGQYLTRGLMADVYTGSVSSNGAANIYSWYFSSKKVQVVEKENVEKNVLLRMVVRPKTGTGKEGVAEINFYNFVKEEPSVFMYDLTSCYNESVSKNLVLTLAGNSQLKGYEKLLKQHVHLALKDTMGVRKQRIFVQDVTSTEEYIYAAFKLLDRPAAIGDSSTLDFIEPSLNEAFSKLKAAVESKNFTVRVPTKNKTTIALRPEPDGLNEFSGDRSRLTTAEGYKEASVIVLTIVMLCLGIILGGIAVNLVISKKFGVSLFQKNAYGDSPFNNPLNESNM